MKTYQLFVPTYRIQECLDEIKICLEKGWTGLGFKTIEFEEAWKEYTGLPNAHFLNSATSGLHLAVKILKDYYLWENDAEVISTPVSFISSNHAISYEKLKVVFADVDDYICLDPKSIEERITNKTKAILFVGFGGNTGKLPEVVELCKKYNLKLILDAAHMSGTRLNGENPGKNADVVVYSFQAVKNLPTADAGMICFKEKELDSTCRKLSWLGINKDTFSRSTSDGAYKWRYDVEDVGFKYHGNSVMASIGLVQLKYLEQDNAYRRQLAKWYDKKFENTPVKTTPTAPGCETSQHIYTIRIPDRDKTLLTLNSLNIFPGVHYLNNIKYRMYSYAEGTCPNAEDISNTILSLPLHLKLSKTDIDFIADSAIFSVTENIKNSLEKK